MTILFRYDANGTTTLHLAGTLTTTCVADIDRALASARRHAGPVSLDLSKVSLVDRPMLQYLIDVERHDVRLANCPDHVAQWLRRETSVPKAD